MNISHWDTSPTSHGQKLLFIDYKPFNCLCLSTNSIISALVGRPQVPSLPDGHFQSTMCSAPQSARSEFKVLHLSFTCSYNLGGAVVMCHLDVRLAVVDQCTLSRELPNNMLKTVSCLRKCLTHLPSLRSEFGCLNQWRKSVWYMKKYEHVLKTCWCLVSSCGVSPHSEIVQILTKRIQLKSEESANHVVFPSVNKLRIK